MQSFQQFSLSPLHIRGDDDTLEEENKSFSESFKNLQSNTNLEKQAVKQIQFKHSTSQHNFTQNPAEFTDLLYLWNDYLKNKFERKVKT